MTNDEKELVKDMVQTLRVNFALPISLEETCDALLSVVKANIGKIITRENFRSIMCEYTPSIAEDSGLPSWSQGELDKAYYDVILGKGVWSKIDSQA